MYFYFLEPYILKFSILLWLNFLLKTMGIEPVPTTKKKLKNQPIFFTMKHFIYILFSLPLLTGCKSEPKKSLESSILNCDNLILDPLYNHFYTEDRKSPYTGLCFKLNKKGDTTETINYNLGKVEGVLTTFYASGTKKSETTFKKNKFHGDFKEWDENGNLLFHGVYDDGEFDTTLINNR